MTLKICKNCSEEKDLSGFSPVKLAKDGHATVCKSCAAAKKRAKHKINPAPKYHEDPEKVKQRRHRNYEKNKDKEIANALKWTSENPEKVRESKKRYRQNHPEKHQEWNRHRWKTHKEEMMIQSAEWVKLHPERRKEIASKYAKNNRDKKNKDNAKRRARLLQAMPLWLNEQDILEIDEFYTESDRLTLETGIPHEVDHIIPLAGKNICGLHVPWNLQVSTRSANRKKSNKV